MLYAFDFLEGKLLVKNKQNKNIFSMEADKEEDDVSCPVCSRLFSIIEIEQHVNKCIFLNCTEEQNKRKRSPSPIISCSQPKLSINQISPKDLNTRKPKQSFSGNTKNLAPLFDKKSKGNSSCIQPLNEPETTDKNIERGGTKKLSFVVPLAKQVIPKTFDDFFGQSKILGRETVLRNLLEKGEIPNMILWGPPGCGKTSLSTVISEICKKQPTKYKFITLCAASSGVKEVQNFITLAKNDLKFGKRTVLFMDEIHRFNKKQQDTFLMSVEKGEITLIGATTENPSFIINSALLSRCRVIVMDKLDTEDLFSILEKAAENLDIDIIDMDNPLVVEGEIDRMTIESTALQWLADISDGDARIALGNLQIVIQDNSDKKGKIISIGDIKEGVKKSHMLYDRAGEEHYNIISAMHKSIRGSDDNAALYWTTRMIVSGEDPKYIARRLVRAASEDIGNADPNALQLAVSTMQGCTLLGMPECEVLLAQCAIYLARAPKSREADAALAKTKQLIKNCKGPQPSVPMHLRNAPTKLMKDLGYGQQNPEESHGFMPPGLEGVDLFH